MIDFENVGLIKNNVKILDDVSFHVRKGEFIFLLGPSGAGKSSILRLIHIDLLPTTGTVTVHNYDTVKLKKNRIPLLRRSIGFIFQDYKLIKEKTVFENVSFVLEVTETKRKLIEQKALHAINTVGMTNRLNHYPHQLSGGECQRVAIARAIVLEPFILLADEPIGNLDTENALSIFQLLMNINDSGTAVMLATHRKEFLSGKSARVITLADGRITECMS